MRISIGSITFVLIMACLGSVSAQMPGQLEVGSDYVEGEILLQFPVLEINRPENNSLIYNGDFETADPLGWQAAHIDSSGGYRSLGGNPGGYYILNEGGDSASDPTIWQTITGLVVGTTYRISGDYAAVHGGAGNRSTVSFGVLLDGQDVLELFPPPGPGSGTETPAQGSWAPFSVDFVATSNSVVLSLTGERNGTDSPYAVDNITLQPVAAPDSPPTILDQPQSQAVADGANMTFTVTASGTPPLSYQWFFNIAAIDFESFTSATGSGTILFRNPTFSGSTSPFLDTLPNSSSVTDTFPAGHSGARVLKVAWSFTSGSIDPWLRLTTFNTATYPNPTVDFAQTMPFDLYADRPIRVGLGLRETSTSAAIGANGGTAGTIEFIGVTDKTGTRPNPTRTVPAGVWTTLQFNIPLEPITAFTGNGILESGTGKGVLEHLAIVPADGPGTYNLYLDNFVARRSPVPFGTNATLTLTNVQPADAGNYFVVVSNAFGTANSSNALLVVDPQPPAIIDLEVVPGVGSAEITWRTDEATSAAVEYGLTATYSSTNTLGALLSTNHTVVLPDLKPGTLYHFRVVATDRAGNVTATSDATFTTQVASDLIARDVLAPTQALTDSAFDVTWTIANNGRGSASGTWVDRVYLSFDGRIDSSFLLGEFAFSGELAAGQSVRRTQAVSVPRARVTNGTYHILVIADAGNQVLEGDETNNTSVAINPISVVLPSLPDLVVESIDVATNAFSAQTITVRWTIKNIGAASTDFGYWMDQIFLSTDTTVDSGVAWGNQVPNVSYLAPNEAYVGSVDLKIPITSFGTYYVIVRADSGNNVREDNEQNNVTNKVIEIQLTPPPDLQVISVQAPANSFSGQMIPVTWTVANLGPGPVLPEQSSWVDSVLLSTNTFLDGNARLLHTAGHSGALATNQSYTVQSQNVTLPHNIFGDFYVFVITDTGNQVFEYAYENNNVNYRQTPLHITLTPPPDLVVESVTAPTNVTAGQPTTISWQVLNQGAGDTVVTLWYDSVYFSTNASFDSATILAGYAYHAGVLPAGGRYTESLTYTPPICNSGRLYFYVVTDSYRHVSEYDPGFDAESNNTSGANVTTQITRAVLPDLRVASVVIPSGGNASSNFSVMWTVTNAGPAEAFPGSWSDRVYLSTNTVFDGSAIALGSFGRTGTLTVSNGYSQSQQVTLPLNSSGNYYVFVQADVDGQVAECENEGNNIARSQGTLNVTPFIPPPPPDLQTVAIGAPTSAQSGQSISVAWVVTNKGPGHATSGNWLDTIYLAVSSNRGPNDIQLGSFAHNGSLLAGQSYEATTDVNLPYRLSGAYYVIACADAANSVPEQNNEQNNCAAAGGVLQVTQAPLPDLRVTALTTPASGYAGQGIDVTWTVANTGDGATDASAWSDYVYLSKDQVLDATDPQAAYRQHNGRLAQGESYAETMSVQLPRGISGLYYVFVCSDRRDAVFELNEDNNCVYNYSPLQIDLPPPADLVVTSVAIPTSGSPGLTTTIGWTIRNQGPNSASGVWMDSVYLSRDQTWDIGDTLVGKVNRNQPVQPGESYTASLNATLPGVVPGRYYAIVRADILNNVRENNEANNTGVSSQTMAVDVVELTLGQSYASQLSTGTEQYYKVNVPANEVMAVTLDGADLIGFNELFTRFGAMPNRGQYDFLYDRPFEPDQRIVVPQTQAGYYYHLARGEYVPNPPVPYAIKAELVPFGITSIRPTRIGDNGQVTLTVNGARFLPGATVQLLNGTNVLSASKLTVIDSTTVKVRFYLTNAVHATYDLTLMNPDSQTTSVREAITIETASPLSVSVGADGSLQPRFGAQMVTYCGVANVGNVDVPYTLISAIFDENVKVGFHRPVGTLPLQQIAPDADWEDDTRFVFRTGGFTAAFFIIRDLEPGALIPFSTRVRGFSVQQFAAQITAVAMTAWDFQQALLATAEASRESVLQNPTVQLPPEAAKAVNSRSEWWSLHEPFYVQAGFIDNLNLLHGDTMLRHPEQQLRTAVGSAGTGDCILCYISTAMGALSCVVCIATEALGVWACVSCAQSALRVPLSCTGKNCFTRCPPGEYWDSCAGVNNPGRGVACVAGCVRPVRPTDPNEITGPAGYGSRRFVPLTRPFSYTIYFENVSDATATARHVEIANKLDLAFDPRTFRLDTISFGSYEITVPDNRSFYQARVQLGTNFNNLWADITAGINIQTGQPFWTLTAIDPATGEPPENPLLGLLPPNDTNHIGEGHVTYTIRTRSGTPTGTVITNSATIIFDNNEPIDTEPVWNTVDGAAPASSIVALPPVSTTNSFTLSWSGVDDTGGSGMASFDIWVSDNGGAYQAVLGNTTLNSTFFTGEPGHTYAFYSTAHDNAGNVEAAHPMPDATTRIHIPPMINSVPDVSSTVGGALTITNVATDPNGTGQQLTFSLDPGAPSGASITTNGVFTWTPACAQGSTTNLIRIWVASNGDPPLSNSITFTVVVGECVQVGVGEAVVQVGQRACVPVNLLSTVGLTNLSFTLAYPANRFADFVITATNPVIAAAVVQALDASDTLFGLSTTPADVLQGPTFVGSVCFTALPGTSAFVPLVVTDVAGTKSDGSPAGNTYGEPGRVAVIGREPLLEAFGSTNASVRLLLYGEPGGDYVLESANTLTSAWSPWQNVTLSNLFLELTIYPSNQTRFVRALRH